jgi:hypothetical protein
MSPHLCHDLAAESPPTRLTVGHQALGGGDDRDTEATLDARQVARTPIDTVTGL